jgi:KaiC/GvpD/RAD55 family RecA-like ATPase
MHNRVSTGVPGLDELLGGGLLPGTLTVVLGATGCGKTQLGLQFAAAGALQEGRRGIVLDMTSRGDSQSHADYAQRLFGWRINPADADAAPCLEVYFEGPEPPADYLHVFSYQGRRVTRSDLDEEGWRVWQAEVGRKLSATIAFFYGAFVRGVRRAVIDGIEPADRPGQSIQLELFEYVYHQILRKDPEWVARDLFRQHYRRNAEAAAERRYDPGQVAAVLLCTTRETLLDELATRPLDEGDVLAGANTIVCLGRTRQGQRMGRALFIPKHRGSAACDEIVPYEIDDRGLRIAPR